MMDGAGESDSAIVAGKPTNKAEQSAAEPAEQRAGAEGNASRHSTVRAQDRGAVSQGLERIRQVAVTHPRWEPYARIGHVRICAGGAQQ
jgi:RNA-directed DNA polymerase